MCSIIKNWEECFGDILLIIISEICFMASLSSIILKLYIRLMHLVFWTITRTIFITLIINPCHKLLLKRKADFVDVFLMVIKTSLLTSECFYEAGISCCLRMSIWNQFNCKYHLIIHISKIIFVSISQDRENIAFFVTL